MKIAITASGEGLDARVDSRFGRAARFVFHDTETGECRTVDNTQNLNAAQGAGIQAAQTVAGLDVEAVITGHCGPKAFKALKAAGIRVLTGAEGTVAAAVEQLKAGKLKELEQADVDGHWA